MRGRQARDLRRCRVEIAAAVASSAGRVVGHGDCHDGGGSVRKRTPRFSTLIPTKMNANLLVEAVEEEGYVIQEARDGGG